MYGAVTRFDTDLYNIIKIEELAIVVLHGFLDDLIVLDEAGT